MRTYLNFTMEYVLYDLSYANLVLLSSVIPSYDSKKKKGKKGQNTLGFTTKGNTGGLKGLFSTLKGMKNG